MDGIVRTAMLLPVTAMKSLRLVNNSNEADGVNSKASMAVVAMTFLTQLIPLKYFKC